MPRDSWLQSWCFLSEREESSEEEKEIESVEEESPKVKLLLLGPAESGKSTVLKQMRILHANGFSALEIEQHRPIIRQNLVDAILLVLDSMETLNIAASPEAEEMKGKLRKEVCTIDFFAPLRESVKKLLIGLCGDVSVQESFQHGSKINLSDGSIYFLDQLERVVSDDYTPTVDDILHARVQTTGIIQMKIPYEKFPLVVFDVGGQRSQRRKWIHCFDDVNAVMFIASVSGYDQMLTEDKETNRLLEALRVFASICNNDAFFKAGMILLLNKIDLFREKIKTVPLTVCFPSYTGEQDYRECLAYIKERFVGMNHIEKKKIYPHFTCATDTRQVEFILDACFEIISSSYMKNVGLE